MLVVMKVKAMKHSRGGDDDDDHMDQMVNILVDILVE